MRFEQQVALVTGAASGIGRALVQRLVAEGAAVVVVDIVETPLQTLVADLQAQGARITGCSANVARESDVETMLNTATSTFGRLDILCNNAGIPDLVMPAAEVLLELWERVLSVNLYGPFLACRRAIPLFLEQGEGTIINTASEAGLRGGATGTPYTVSKHGVVGLTRSIAFHYGERGIRCNAVCPGRVATPIGAGNGVPSEAGLGRVIPFVKGSAPSRVATPEEIAAVMAFLASKEASFINGAILPVDGGGLPPDLPRLERSKRAAPLKASQQRKQEMKNLNKIVIIGAGATGLTTAETFVPGSQCCSRTTKDVKSIHL